MSRFFSFVLQRPANTRGFSQRLRCWTLFLLLLSPLAHAQSFFDCTVGSTGVEFGQYDPIAAAALDGSGQIVIDCRPNIPLVTVSLSTGGSDSYAARRMQSGANTLQYNLYTNAARTTVFGNGTGGSQTVLCITGVISLNGCIGSNPAGAGRRAILPFYGRIPPDQNVAAGTYSDTLYVQIDF